MGRPAEVQDLFRTKVEMPKLEEETPKEANVEKTTMPKEKVPTAKAGSSSTTEGSKERPCKPDEREEEKKVLQDLVWNLERMFVKQKECVTTLGSDEA